MNLLAQPKGRIALFTLLYLSEGGPIGFIWWALPTMLRTAGVAVPQITALTALLVLPWVFKFLWAPLVDACRTPRWGFRAWIITAQLAMGAALLPLSWLDPVEHFPWWGALLLLHAFCAATQDVAIDALAIHAVPESQRGTLNGCMQTGMLVGRSLFGGGALLIVSVWGKQWVIIALVTVIWTTSLCLLGAKESVENTGFKNRIADFRLHLSSAFRRRTTWLGLAFALTAAAGFEATGQLAGPFLVDRGVPEKTIGVFFGAVVVATVLGGLIGGKLSDRWGRIRAVAVFLIGFVAMIVGLAWTDLALANPNPTLLFSWLTGMYFFIGLFTAASYALFMDLTDPRLGGTQFSAFMAATNGCESGSAWAAGRVMATTNYATAFLVLSAASLLSLPLLVWLAKAGAKKADLETGAPTL
ncbi:MAG: MFS transporter [Acidobacteriia bacterium]|nr:MFS transporter [Terriglobia bacterium]